MRGRNDETVLLQKMIRPLLIGGIAGAVVCGLVLLLMAALMTVKDLPAAANLPMALTAAGIASLTGGLISARLMGERGWLMGLLCGVLLFTLLLLAGGFQMLTNFSASAAPLKLAVMLAASMTGGVLGVRSNRTNARRKSTRHR
ncbi:MAG: TIGR04086 family membrane protein [Oscillospiraceae bacterium]|nr:TIGR04086 family membrane protein [Oscillospiraceae bacterium]